MRTTKRFTGSVFPPFRLEGQSALDWPVAQTCREVVEAADSVGRRRRYVSNIAKRLGLRPPSSLALTPPDVAREHLPEIRALLSGGAG